MNLLSLSYAYIRARWLPNLLMVILLGLGVATIGLLLHFGNKAEDKLTRDARGIDLVVGAKGSPLQLVLSSIYHMDVPTGNIDFADAEKLRNHPQVKLAIPMALGDSYQGFRIVGTEQTYVTNYNGKLANGQFFAKPFEAVIGSQVAAETGLAVNATFAGSHGTVETSAEHTESPYKIVGVLNPTGSVLDRLILTPVESSGEHAGEEKHEDHADEAKSGEPAGEEKHEENADEHSAKKEITALLISFKTRAAALSMPREINRQTALQAASPAFEAARFFSLMGIGLDALRLFGGVLIGSAILGMLVAVYQAMQERRVDYGVMRVLGASKFKVLTQIVLETGMLLSAGILTGVLLCHMALAFMPNYLPQLRDFGFSGLVILPSELYLALGLLVAGLIFPSQSGHGLSYF